MSKTDKLFVKIMHQGMVKLKRGTLSAPVNKLIEIDREEYEILRRKGVKIIILSEVASAVKKTTSAVGKTVIPVSSKAEKETVTEQPEDDEVKVNAEEQAPENVAEEEPVSEDTEEVKTDAEEQALDEVAEEEVIEDETSEEDTSIDPEYIKNLNDTKELKEYAKQLGISTNLSKNKMKAAIIKALESEE